MAKKMLIDAAHPEETRVVVISGNRVEEFDYEAAARRQLRGNIYLAKVTRVEPSLQAAFVDYGGNRHGFLSFSEIHPDYYQIPVADRESLLAQQAEEDRSAAAAEDAAEEQAEAAPSEGEDAESIEAGDAAADDTESSETAENTEGTEGAEDAESDEAGKSESIDDDTVESVGVEDALEEVPVRQARRHRSYKIQEVIKRRQILLVQVVKEERGTKGAALTSYISLAGRYCVLMPNTARGGGISRKITHITDRKRLKSLVADLDVTDGMGLIVRTAGANRTKVEIRRDFEYLTRLWENIRELTLKSTAPAIIYEEGSLVKRSIRDLYSKDIEEVHVDGEEAYREAKDLMRMLMPSHAKKVQPYKDRFPLFQRYKIEQQLDAMFSPDVQLKSGGYIVINPTEALVSIDVNSGRSTREKSIEETALSTNLEAAVEVARQLRLRDLAGLVVIDFIDMEYQRNNRAVERKLKDALKSDRARIQVGRLSHFGLLEMSRQRMRASLFEGSMQPCPSCGGTGHVRAVESTALHVLRAVEEEGLRDRSSACTVEVAPNVALYILNQKRMVLVDIEQRFAMSVVIEANATLKSDLYELQRTPRVKGDATPLQGAVISVESGFTEDTEEGAATEDAATEDTVSADAEQVDEGDKEPKRRRRRRKPRARKSAAGSESDDAGASDEEAAEGVAASEIAETPSGGSEGDGEQDATGERKRRPRRRGKRGGRRTRRTPGESSGESSGEEPVAAQAEEPADTGVSETSNTNTIVETDNVGSGNGASPQSPYVAYSASADTSVADDTDRTGERTATPDTTQETENGGDSDTPAVPALSEVTNTPDSNVVAEMDDGEPSAVETPTGPQRKGWWQRRAT